MSQFIEMFGIAEATKPLADFIEVSFPGEWGQEDKDGSGVKVIRTTNFTNNGKLDLSEVVTRDIDSAKIEKKKLFKGDIILERSGGTNDNPVGRVVYFEEDGVYLFNNFTQLLRCKEGVNSLFIFYSLFNYYQMNKNVIRSMGNKTTGIQNLKMDRYWQIPIADVSIELQKEFESIYRQADKSGFVGFKSQFIEMFGGDKYHQMELASIAENWLKGQAFRKDNICEDGTNICIHYGELFTKYGPIIYDVSSTTNDDIMKASKSGDILFPASDVTPDGLARCSAIMSDGVLLGGDIIVLRPKQGNNSEYLSWAINMQKEQLLKRVTGSVVRHMSAKGLKTVQIPIAPIEKQKQFINIVNQADKSGYYN